MIRKILFIMVLAVAAAIGGQAFVTSAVAQRSDKDAPGAAPKAAEVSPLQAAEAAPSQGPVLMPKAGETPASSAKSAFPAAPSSFIPSPLPPKPDLLPKKSEPAPTKSEAAGAKDASKKSSPAVTPVSASPLDAKAGRKELVIERGLVTLIYDNKVPASEPGMLTEVPVEEGQSVEKGDLLAQIDSRSTHARQRIADAEWQAANAQADNDAEVEVAKKAEQVTKAIYDQSVEIRKKNPGAVSETELRKQFFDWEKSIAQIKQAENEKHIAGLTANGKKAQHDAATIELDLRQARAPFRGQVVEVMKKPGDWVTAGEPIMHIVGLDKVRVKGFVLMSGPNGASHDEVLGKDVTITVYGAGDRKHTVKGTIGFASPVIEGVGTSRQFRVWADVENEKSVDPTTGQEIWKIQPGSMATIVIDMTTRPVATRVNAYRPVSAEAKSADAKSNGKSTDSKVTDTKRRAPQER